MLNRPRAQGATHTMSCTCCRYNTTVKNRRRARRAEKARWKKDVVNNRV